MTYWFFLFKFKSKQKITLSSLPFFFFFYFYIVAFCFCFLWFCCCFLVSFFPLNSKSDHNGLLEKLEFFPPVDFTLCALGFGDRAEAEVPKYWNGRVELGWCKLLLLYYYPCQHHFSQVQSRRVHCIGVAVWGQCSATQRFSSASKPREEAGMAPSTYVAASPTTTCSPHPGDSNKQTKPWFAPWIRKIRIHFFFWDSFFASLSTGQRGSE